MKNSSSFVAPRFQKLSHSKKLKDKKSSSFISFQLGEDTKRAERLA